MVKHTQTMHQQFADELFQCVRPFCGVGTSRLNTDNLLTLFLMNEMNAGIL